MEKKSSYNYDELLSCGRGAFFGPGNAQLPLPPMLMFDSITHVSSTEGKNGKGLIRGQLSVHPDLWFFSCHFKGDPVMPGCLGLDALWQLFGFFLAWTGAHGRGRAVGVREVKFADTVTPETKLVEYEVSVVRIIRREIVFGIGDGIVTADGREIYHAEGLRVGIFREASNAS